MHHLSLIITSYDEFLLLRRFPSDGPCSLLLGQIAPSVVSLHSCHFPDRDAVSPSSPHAFFLHLRSSPSPCQLLAALSPLWPKTAASALPLPSLRHHFHRNSRRQLVTALDRRQRSPRSTVGSCNFQCVQERIENLHVDLQNSTP